MKPREWRLQREGEEEQASNDRDRWLVTYADMITLLMVFFVVMYALSSRISASNFAKLKGSLQVVLGNHKKPLKSSPAPQSLFPSEDQVGQTTTEMKAALAPFVGRSQVKIDLTNRGLVISLFDTTFFGANSAEITPPLADALTRIAAEVATMSNAIRIEGHTDNSPTGTGPFSSNWDLAARRAVKVVEFLATRGHIKPQRLSAVSYAQYRPIVPNDTPQDKALNRRVDVVISRTGPQPALTPTPAPFSQLVPSTPAPNSGFQNPF
ncbi:MAG: flagellar motor protein MotB, partial [Cyanobacteria bacterium REEB65]|nr:flagellar motor protein MotB [Cyanobacteria bacterium REEB65]